MLCFAPKNKTIQDLYWALGSILMIQHGIVILLASARVTDTNVITQIFLSITEPYLGMSLDVNYLFVKTHPELIELFASPISS